MWLWYTGTTGELSLTSSSPPSPTKSEQFQITSLVSPFHLLGMELLAVCIWLSSLLWSMVLIFPINEVQMAPLVCLLISFSLWRSPPMGSKVTQDLLKKSWFQFSFASSVSFHFSLGILSSSIVASALQFHWIIVLYKLTRWSQPQIFILLSSAGSVFTISFLKHRMSWSKPLSQTNVPRRNLCSCTAWRLCWHSTSSIWSCTLWPLRGWGSRHLILFNLY